MARLPDTHLVDGESAVTGVVSRGDKIKAVGLTLFGGSTKLSFGCAPSEVHLGYAISFDETNAMIHVGVILHGNKYQLQVEKNGGAVQKFDAMDYALCHRINGGLAYETANCEAACVGVLKDMLDTTGAKEFITGSVRVGVSAAMPSEIVDALKTDLALNFLVKSKPSSSGKLTTTNCSIFAMRVLKALGLTIPDLPKHLKDSGTSARISGQFVKQFKEAWLCYELALLSIS